MLTKQREAAWPQGVTLVAQAVLPTMGAMVLVPVVPLLQQRFGAMPHAGYWIPALLTVPALCIALLSSFAGLLGDLFGRRRLLVAALSIYGLAGLTPFVLEGFVATFASRIVLGLCEAAIVTLSSTMLGDYFAGRARERWLALISTTATLSAVLLLFVGGALGAILGWRGPFLVYALALPLVPAMLLLTWEPAPESPATSGTPARFPWPHMTRAAIVTLFGSSLFYTLAIQQSLGLAALGLHDPGRIGLLSSIASLGNPVGTLVFWKLARLRTPLLLSVEFTILALGLFGMSVASSDVAFASATLLGMFGAGLLMPTLITWTMAGLDHAVRGRGTGVFQSTFALGQFASALIVPALAANVTGGILPAFCALGWASTAAAIIGLVLALRRQPTLSPTR